MTTAAPSKGYRHVQEVILARITSGEWKPGFKIPSERDLEKEFSLSRLTIGKGLANLAAQGLLDRKQGQGTFVSRRPRNGNGTRHLFKSISPGGEDQGVTVHPGILEGMCSHVAGKPYHVAVDFYREPKEQIEILRRDCDEHHAGFVIWYEHAAANQEAWKELSTAGYPYVLLDAYPESREGDFVVTDNLKGARLVVERLAGLGHRRVAYVTRPPVRSSLRDRQAGFLQGLVEFDLTMWDGVIARLPESGPEAIAAVPAVVDGLLDRPEAPTAIAFSNDDLALAAMEHLEAGGIAVPGEVSIVGYDDTDRAGYGNVPLTTIKQDFAKMGRIAAEVLEERIEGEGTPRPVQIFVEPSLVVRQSTGAAREADLKQA